ncbi:hypothetical protein Goshw_017425, partial [Gossypium schwendimanii]|nr:hypothetical protein [Gossypium schwendimanii]
MPRSRSKEGEAPSDDYGWRWGEPVEDGCNNVKCKFCERFIKGGITRLKEHLAAKIKKNVAPFPNVLAEVRKNIAQQLNKCHNEKIVQRRKEELEERIRLGDHRDYGDSDANDKELTITR